MIKISMTRLEKVVLFACAFTILIHAVASFFPKERLWGVNQLAYVSFIPRWIIIISAFLILVPKVNKILYDVFAGFFNLVEKNLKRINRHYKYIFFSLVSIILFWVFKTKTHLLGDGYVRGNEIVAGMKLSITEPLDFYLHVLVYRFLKLDVYQTYTLISCLAGALFVFLALWLSHLLGKEGKEKVLAFVILVSMGSVQLFFGYIESYSLVYAGMMAYFLLSFLYLKGRCGLFFPSLTLLVSISLHLSAAYLLPSLIYLHLVDSQKEKKQFIFKKILNVVFLLLLVGVGFVILSHKNPNPTSITSYLIPLAGGENAPYSLFSGAHLVDIINEQLLLSPAGIILLGIVIFCARKIDFKDKVVIFLVIVTLFSFLFAFLMDPKLGYARDWDLFSSTGLGYTLLGIYIGFDYFRRAKTKKLNYIVLALASTVLFSTLPWIYVNAQESKSVERFKALLDLDVERGAYGHEILAYYYRDKRLINKEAEEWEKAFSIVENERYAVNLGKSYGKLERYQEAIAIFKRVIQLNPNSANGYFNLGNALLDIGKYEEAQKQYQMAINRDPYFYQAYARLGALLTEMGHYEEGLKVLKSAIEINPDYFLTYYGIAIAYSRMGKPKEGIALLRAYFERNPQEYQKVQQLLKKMNIDVE
ncbi:MAG: tetratricopeptide repeat protein [candidate division Zixibacteria bacterium]|nr:tetratricopeptide repeat protein [candidate division Zixibacteria bacterium]